MPIKLDLVFTRRPQPTIVAPRPLHYKAHTSQPAAKQVTKPAPVEQQNAGLSLRRVMNAPKTGCKSCGG